MELPRIDEHQTVITADVAEVWRALLDSVDHGFSRAGASVYARVVGCKDCTASGPRPLAEGSTLPGFRVTAAMPARELALEGRHRFSTYALVFRLEGLGSGRSRLRAESRGAFPGLHGAVYRLLVIGTGGHAMAVRRLLGGIRRRAEHTPDAHAPT